MATQSRLLIVVNKFWECDPVCWVLTSMYLKDKCKVNVPWAKLEHYPSYGPVQTQPPTPRLIYSVGDVQLEVWCISDLLSIFPKGEPQSSSLRKMEVLGKIFSYSSLPVHLVTAVGTASSGPFCPEFQGAQQVNINGSVVVGCKIFMHDGHPASNQNSNSEWRCEYFDQLMTSSLCGSAIQLPAMADLDSALLSPSITPAPKGQHIYVNKDYISLGNINVSNYAEYTVKDKETGDSFIATCPGNANGVSMETTHGVIYAAAREHFQGDPPFMFISSIVDRYTLFDTDVKPREYAQNVTGAHNAGVVVARLVEHLLSNGMN
jgi:hypothetical protein